MNFDELASVNLDELSKAMKAFRAREDLSLVEFAKLVNCSHGTINNIEERRNDPSKKILSRICEVLQERGFTPLLALQKNAGLIDASSFLRVLVTIIGNETISFAEVSKLMSLVMKMPEPENVTPGLLLQFLLE